jgi:hypothetical protein
MEMIATSNMYKNVCRSGPDAKGLNVSMRGTLNSTLEVACHGGTDTCPACPACDPCSGPPGDCSGGVAANMFGAADADTDMRLTQVEAERIAKELPIHPHASKSCRGVSLHSRYLRRRDPSTTVAIFPGHLVTISGMYGTAPHNYVSDGVEERPQQQPHERVGQRRPNGLAAALRAAAR